MAGNIPPSLPPFVGLLVRNSQSMTGRPLIRMYPMITTSIRSTKPITAVRPPKQNFSLLVELIPEKALTMRAKTAVIAMAATSAYTSLVSSDENIHTPMKTSTYSVAMMNRLR